MDTSATDYSPKAIERLAGRMAGLYGYDHASESDRRRFSLSRVDILEGLRRAYNFMARGQHPLALVQLNRVAEEVLGRTGFSREDFTGSGFSEKLRRLSVCRDVTLSYEAWKTGSYRHFLAKMGPDFLWEEGERTTESIDPALFIKVEEAQEKDLVTLYRYRDGEAEAAEVPRRYRLFPYLVISPSVDGWLDFISERKQEDPSIPEITFFLKLEEIEVFSTFLLTIRYRDRVWIATDKIHFANPVAMRKRGMRNGGRRAIRDRWNTVYFPYELIDDLGKIRAAEKRPAAPNLPSELLFEELSELETFHKAFLVGTIETMLREVAARGEEAEVVTTAREYVEGKLLVDDTATFRHDEASSSLSYYNGPQKEVARERMSSVGQEEEALTRKGYKLVTQAENYDPDWLDTPDRMREMSQWFVLDNERIKAQKKLDALKDRRKEDWEVLNELLQNARERITREAFRASELHMLLPAYRGLPPSERDRLHEEGRGIDHFGEQAKARLTKVRFAHASQDPSPVWVGGGAFLVGGLRCKECGRYKARTFRKIEIRFWKQLVYLLGLDGREELPPYWRNYRAHDFEPYRGNSILSQIHPYSLLRDPASRAQPNGTSINVNLCGYCARSYRAGTPDKLTIDLEGEEVDEDLPHRSPGTVISF